jgi:hypothetical protein
MRNAALYDNSPCLKPRADRTLHRFFIFAPWLTLINGILFTSVPNPLVAGDMNYSVTFTRQEGDPQDFHNVTITVEGVVLFQFPLHFHGNQPKTIHAGHSEIAQLVVPGYVLMCVLATYMQEIFSLRPHAFIFASHQYGFS